MKTQAQITKELILWQEERRLLCMRLFGKPKPGNRKDKRCLESYLRKNKV